ncbi:LysR substrate-binding domain-containing protein [Pigmentiphaga soli]|uniref:LysR substrate-binding domain-containing protein n=1 Tax=Pigmentiphaga soli TaxID=1007095 RepID=A0ABP8H699_9BURK
MDLRRLEYFVKVVEAASFSRAAIVMRMAQSTLSRQIGELEQELGQQLLVRTGRGVAPTEAGLSLLAHARSMLAIAQHARKELLDLDASPRGRVAVGMPSLIALQFGGRLAKAFQARFPLAVLTLTEGLSLHLREWLVEGRLDVAVLFDPLPSPQLDYTVLAREPLVLVAPAGHKPLPASVPLEALPGYPLVLPSPPNAVRNLLDEALRPAQVSLNIATEVGAAHTMLAMVAEGVGCTILPESALRVSGLANGQRLQSASIGPPAIWNSRTLALPKYRPAPRLVRETVAMLKQLIAG